MSATPQSVTSGLAPSDPAAVQEVPVQGLEETLQVEIKHVGHGRDPGAGPACDDGGAGPLHGGHHSPPPRGVL